MLRTKKCVFGVGGGGCIKNIVKGIDMKWYFEQIECVLFNIRSRSINKLWDLGQTSTRSSLARGKKHVQLDKSMQKFWQIFKLKTENFNWQHKLSEWQGKTMIGPLPDKNWLYWGLWDCCIHLRDFFQIVNMGGFGSKLWGSALHIPVMIALQLVFIVLFGLFTRLSMPW